MGGINFMSKEKMTLLELIGFTIKGAQDLSILNQLYGVKYETKRRIVAEIQKDTVEQIISGLRKYSPIAITNINAEAREQGVPMDNLIPAQYGDMFLYEIEQLIKIDIECNAADKSEKGNLE